MTVTLSIFWTDWCFWNTTIWASYYSRFLKCAKTTSTQIHYLMTRARCTTGGKGNYFSVTCYITSHMSCHMSHVSLHIMCQVRSSDSQISNQIKYQLKYGEVCSQLSFQVLIQVSIPKTINIHRLNKVGRLFIFGVKLTGSLNVCTLLYSFY